MAMIAIACAIETTGFAGALPFVGDGNDPSPAKSCCKVGNKGMVYVSYGGLRSYGRVNWGRLLRKSYLDRRYLVESHQV